MKVLSTFLSPGKYNPAYDTADDSDDAILDYSDSEQRDASDDFSEVEDYSDVQIDWSAWISSMPDPVLLD